MSRSRAIVVLLALLLALPSAAFGQGAGDEQYQDPFGDEQTQGDGNGGGGGNGASGRAAQDDGLSDAPPVDGGGDTSGDDGSGDDGSTEGEDPGTSDETAPGEQKALPNTGSDPRVLAYVGLLFVLTGVGLRLRSLDPNDF